MKTENGQSAKTHTVTMYIHTVHVHCTCMSWSTVRRLLADTQDGRCFYGGEDTHTSDDHPLWPAMPVSPYPCLRKTITFNYTPELCVHAHVHVHVHTVIQFYAYLQVPVQVAH